MEMTERKETYLRASKDAWSWGRGWGVLGERVGREGGADTETKNYKREKNLIRVCTIATIVQEKRLILPRDARKVFPVEKPLVRK